MKSTVRSLGLLALIVCASIAGYSSAQSRDGLIDRGRYLAKIAGCNDCHTAGYLLADGQIPESEWLLGDSFGWRGPWGTTYAPNLRQRLDTMTEEQWLVFARNLRSRPPMPWFSLAEMTEEDLRGLYAYVRHLGPAGQAAPAYLPPDQEPPPPYALFPSPPPQ